MVIMLKHDSFLTERRLIKAEIQNQRYFSSNNLIRKLKNNSFANTLYTFAALKRGLSKKGWKLQPKVASSQPHKKQDYNCTNVDEYDQEVLIHVFHYTTRFKLWSVKGSIKCQEMGGGVLFQKIFIAQKFQFKGSPFSKSNTSSSIQSEGIMSNYTIPANREKKKRALAGVYWSFKGKQTINCRMFSILQSICKEDELHLLVGGYSLQYKFDSQTSEQNSLHALQESTSQSFESLGYFYGNQCLKYIIQVPSSCIYRGRSFRKVVPYVIFQLSKGE